MRNDFLHTAAGYECLTDFWGDVLYTHVKSLPERFAYILGDKFFVNRKSLATDFLARKTITEIGVFYETAVNFFDSHTKRGTGVFYTPDDVANFMVSHYGMFPEGIWLDPCCGVGNLAFALVEAAGGEKFLENNMLLADVDALAVFTARVLLTVAFQKDNPRLFYSIEPNFRVQDFLTDNSGRADFIIMNPPYVSGVRNSSFVTDKCGDQYAFFMEQAIKTSRGFISITPQSFTNSRKFETLRQLMLDNGRFDLYVFDNVPDCIFKGKKIGVRNTNKANSVRGAITIYKNTTNSQDDNENFKTNRITGFLRWKTSEREEAFKNFKNQLGITHSLTKQVFPKIPKKLNAFYEFIKPNPRLEEWLTTDSEHVLYVPSTPRYYITATKRELNRSSIKKLCFKNEDFKNVAYVLLNSYIAYWWWRAVDGGMTLSMATLKSLPLLEPVKDERSFSVITGLLEYSERDNLVFKMNAGKRQENVKHDPTLRHMATSFFVVPESTVRELERTAENSFL